MKSLSLIPRPEREKAKADLLLPSPKGSAIDAVGVPLVHRIFIPPPARGPAMPPLGYRAQGDPRPQGRAAA